jgi:hypothetical protein
MTSVVRSRAHDEAVDAIIHNPHIVSMYLGIEDDLLSGAMTAADLESWDFIQASNREFTRRNGTGAQYIGTVAEALQKIHRATTPAK